MPQLLLIRHGQTDWNKEGRYTGQSDIPLNSLGYEQARAVVELLDEHPPTRLYSSDLLRARQTAAPLAERFDLEVRVDARLREINQGEWEGMLFPDIKRKFAQEFAAQRANPLAVAAPGGESVGNVKERVFASLEDILNVGGEPGPQRIAIVCHGFVIALIRLYFSKKPLEEVWDLIPKNVEIIRINTEELWQSDTAV